jgi:hypothetical protein
MSTVRLYRKEVAPFDGTSWFYWVEARFLGFLWWRQITNFHYSAESALDELKMKTEGEEKVLQYEW